MTLNQLTNLFGLVLAVSIGQGCTNQAVLKNVIACTSTRPGELHAQTVYRLGMQLSRMDYAFVSGNELLTDSENDNGLNYKIRSTSISKSQLGNMKIIKVDDQLCAVKQ